MPEEGEPLTHFAFGSCNNQRLDQSHWDNIASHEPNFWMWLGDTIYADNTNTDQRWGQYQSLVANPFYSHFKENTWITGIWDDHDFDSNGAGGYQRDTNETENLFLDFLGVSEDDFARTHRGIYRSYTFGPIGKRVKFILLDTRSFKENPGRESSLLS